MTRVLSILLAALVVSSAAFAQRSPHAAVVARKNAGGGGGFTANTAVFDGTNDYLNLGATLTGTVDSRVFTLSVWVRFDGGDGAEQRIWQMMTGTNTARLAIYRLANNTVRLLGRSSGAVDMLDAATTSTLTAASGWTHLYVCIDLNNSSNRHIYFDGVDQTVTWTTYSSAAALDLVMSSPKLRVGADGNGANLLNGALAELWFDDAYLDAPGSFASGGAPISIGANGETPNSAAPALYLSLNGSGDSWAVDSSGNSNTFTAVSTLGTTTIP